MAENKTQPTDASVEEFLAGLTPRRRDEAARLIALMGGITGEPAVLWGPSIVGFGSRHYRYDTGREGDMPRLGFSPRKAALTIYFDGFDRYSEQLARLGKHRTSVSCLYLNSLADVDVDVLAEMLRLAHGENEPGLAKPTTVAEYLARVPAASREQLDRLRALASEELPEAHEVLSYGIIGYRLDAKRARVYVSGWKDHVAVYPVPDDPDLAAELAPFVRGKGTLWFALGRPLPDDLLRRTVRALAGR